jgi:hypothetical protein
MDLNAGGLIGALVCGGVAGAVVFSTVDLSETNRGPYRLILLALIAGAFAGNFLWGLAFKKPPSSGRPEGGPPEAGDTSQPGDGGVGGR